MMHAGVLSDGAAVGGHNLTALLFHLDSLGVEIGVHESGVVAVGNEADFVALVLFSDGQSHLAGQGADLCLGHFAQRKQSARELSLGETEEKIGLVFAGIYSPSQLETACAGILRDAGIMAGGDLRCGDAVRQVEKLIELDEVITECAGNGRTASQVFGDKGLDYLVLELVLEVDDVVRDAELLSDAPGIINIIERAAAPGSRVVGKFGNPPLAPQLHRQAPYGMASTN